MIKRIIDAFVSDKVMVEVVVFFIVLIVTVVFMIQTLPWENKRNDGLIKHTNKEIESQDQDIIIRPKEVKP